MSDGEEEQTSTINVTFKSTAATYELSFPADSTVSQVSVAFCFLMFLGKRSLGGQSKLSQRAFDAYFLRKNLERCRYLH